MSHEASQPPAPQPADTRPKRHAWVPITAIVVSTVFIVGTLFVQSLEIGERLPPAETGLAVRGAALLGVLLVYLWFVFLSGASRTLRTRVSVVGLVLIVAPLAALRIEDVSGDVVPRLRFRWSRHADETLRKAEEEESAGEPVDLATTTPDDYAQFLGPDRLATLAGPRLARDWSAEPPKQLWRQPIGAGWSAFAVVGPFAVTQEQRGEEELITCYEVESGKLRWSHSTPVRFHETLAGIGPRATPTIHEGKVYAMGAKGNLACLDGATGKAIWQHDVATENRALVPVWGKSCSPLIDEDKVIVSAGGLRDKSLVAYDKETGKFVWSGGDDPSSYSSPALLTLAGVPQIVIVNEGSVTGHDRADGRVLWRHVWPEERIASPNVSQPLAVDGDHILLTKGYGVGSALWQIKLDGDEWSVEPLWSNLNLKTKFTNAVIREGFAYGLDEGILSCIEIQNGRKAWKKGKYGHGQVLLVDDLLLVQSESGDLALVATDPKAYRELTRFPNAISGICWNTMALAGRKLLMRSGEEAACYELPVGSP